jgi:hypothetical protein
MLYVQLEFCTIDLSVLVIFLVISTTSWAFVLDKMSKTNFFGVLTLFEPIFDLGVAGSSAPH